MTLLIKGIAFGKVASTLHHEHALLGILIPGTPAAANGNYAVHVRLYENIESGYALALPVPASQNPLRSLSEDQMP